MAYAILRFNKIKSVGGIKTVQLHNERERETPNADKEIENVVVHGEPNKTYLDSYKEITQGMNIRKNAVLAIECFMSVSPEANFLKDQDKIFEWSKNSVEWLEKKFGKENIIKSHLHLDEKTPHLHTFIIPTYTNNKGRKNLNARHYIGGSRFRLSDFQTDYHKSVCGFGLERGLIGSQAKHMDIKKFYSLVNESLEKELPKTKILESSKAYRDRIMEEYTKLYSKYNALILENENLKTTLETRKKRFKERAAIDIIIKKNPAIKNFILDEYNQQSNDKIQIKENVKEKIDRLKIKEKYKKDDRER